MEMIAFANVRNISKSKVAHFHEIIQQEESHGPRVSSKSENNILQRENCVQHKILRNHPCLCFDTNLSENGTFGVMSSSRNSYI